MADKVAFLRRHKFTIAFENESHPFYSTEKIVEAFAAHTVPIYWGKPRVADDFNPKAFINAHDFKSLDALVDFVAQVDKDDARYQQYLAQEPFVGGVDAIHALDERVFTAFKQMVECPPVPQASQRLHSRMRRAWHGLLKA